MKKILAALLIVAPSIASAQVITDVSSLTYKLTNLGNTFIQILIAFAVLWIVLNVVRFIMNAGDDAKRKEHQSAILWGIVGLFVILSIWGLVKILTNTFRTDNTNPTNQYPKLPYPQNVP